MAGLRDRGSTSWSSALEEKCAREQAKLLAQLREQLQEDMQRL